MEQMFPPLLGKLLFPGTKLSAVIIGVCSSSYSIYMYIYVYDC